MTALAAVPALPVEANDEVGSLLRRAREGDHDAFAALIEEHEAMVFSIARTFFDDRTRAEEIAQDVFLQLYRSLGELETPAHVLFWLRQVTSRRCIDATRRAKFRVAVPLDDAPPLAAPGELRDPLFDRRVRKEIAALPEMQRLVLTLRYQEDLDPSDICRIVGKPVNTVKSILHRALQSLREGLRS
jgi:RNA polymerase sigma-70 factor (ECF subfamily)